MIHYRDMTFCPFYARCEYRTTRCLEENPMLRTVGDKGHQIACWVDIKNGGAL